MINEDINMTIGIKLLRYILIFTKFIRKNVLTILLQNIFNIHLFCFYLLCMSIAHLSMVICLNISFSGGPKALFRCTSYCIRLLLLSTRHLLLSTRLLLLSYWLLLLSSLLLLLSFWLHAQWKLCGLPFNDFTFLSYAHMGKQQ